MYIVGASGNSHIRAYIYLGTYMQEYKPRKKGVRPGRYFLMRHICVYFFRQQKKDRPGRDQVDIFYTRLCTA
jgi:hypothetical protein